MSLSSSHDKAVTAERPEHVGDQPESFGGVTCIEKPFAGEGRAGGISTREGWWGGQETAAFPTQTLLLLPAGKLQNLKSSITLGPQLAWQSQAQVCCARSSRCRGTAGCCSAHLCQILPASILHGAGSRSQLCSWVLPRFTTHLAKMLNLHRGVHRIRAPLLWAGPGLPRVKGNLNDSFCLDSFQVS